MLHEALDEMMRLTEMDSFCRDYYLHTGEYMSIPSMEDVKKLLTLWGKLETVEGEKDLKAKLDAGVYDGLGDIFNRESLFFDEGKDVSILTANRYFKMTEHQHDYFEIEFILDGSAIHNPGDGQAFLKKDDIVLIPPRTPHNLQPIDNATIVDFIIRYSTFENTFQDILACGLPISSYFKNALSVSGRRECIILDGQMDEMLLDVLCLLWQENKSDTFAARKMCAHLTESLLYRIAETGTKDHIFDLYEYQNEEIYLIRRYMLDHLDSVSLDELADRFHRSVPAISKYIKTHSRVGFSALLRSMRLERAADLLLSTTWDIAQIAFSVGYASESNFIACFRSKYEMTPLQYRRARISQTRGL